MNINIFLKYILYVCVCVYIHDKYTLYTHITLTKTIILDAINHHVIFQFFFFNKSAKMSTILCFSVNMGCCVYINEEKKRT